MEKKIYKPLGACVVLLTLSACDSFFTTGPSSYKSYTEQAHDMNVARKIRAALLKDPELKSEEIHIALDRDVVQLSGFVKTPHQASKAGHIASGHPNVKAVINSLVVRPGISYQFEKREESQKPSQDAYKYKY